MAVLSGVGSFDKYAYLTQSSCREIKGLNDAKEFQATVSAMTTVGISGEDQG